MQAVDDFLEQVVFAGRPEESVIVVNIKNIMNTNRLNQLF